MGLLSVAIWLPIAFGVLLLAVGRDEQAGTVRTGLSARSKAAGSAGICR